MALSKNFLQMVQAQQVPQKQAYPTTVAANTQPVNSLIGNPSYTPAFDPNNFNASSGVNTQAENWAGAFDPSLGINYATKNPDGSFNVEKTTGAYTSLTNQATIGPDGKVTFSSEQWQPKQIASNTQTVMQGAALGAALVGAGGMAGLWGGGAGGLSGMDLAADAGVGGANSIGQAAAQFGSALPQAGSIGGMLTGGGDVAGQAGQMAGQMASADTALGQSAYNFAPGSVSGDLGTVGGLADASMAPGIAAGAGDLTGGLLAAGSMAGNVGALDKLAATLGVSKSSLLSLGANAVNGLLGVYASSQAANAQEEAAQKAIDLNKYMYDTTRSDFAPWRETGTWALGQSKNLLQDPSSVTNDPGYQFQLNEGRKALEGSASAHGGLYSGATLKALNRYGNDYATTKFDNVLNRYNALSGSGQTATSGTANAGANYANNAGNAMMGAGNARGSAYIGGANAISGALGNWLNNYNQENMLNRIFPKP